jgi:transcriptional regulator of acetoin/glycerol metabolism
MRIRKKAGLFLTLPSLFDNLISRFSTAASGNARGKIDRQKVIETLEQRRHNISRTAKVLGVSRPTVYHLKRRFGI